MVRWPILFTAGVAFLLSGLTVRLYLLRETDKRNGRRAILILFITASVWAWEAVVRECLRGPFPNFPWDLLDNVTGFFALVLVLLVVRWTIRGRW